MAKVHLRLVQNIRSTIQGDLDTAVSLDVIIFTIITELKNIHHFSYESRESTQEVLRYLKNTTGEKEGDKGEGRKGVK
jgi:hypothetical protein